MTLRIVADISEQRTTIRLSGRMQAHGQTVTLDPLREQIEFAPFTASDRQSVLDVEAERVAIHSLDGAILEQRVDPRSSFPAPTESGARRRGEIHT